MMSTRKIEAADKINKSQWLNLDDAIRMGQIKAKSQLSDADLINLAKNRRISRANLNSACEALSNFLRQAADLKLRAEDCKVRQAMATANNTRLNSSDATFDLNGVYINGVLQKDTLVRKVVNSVGWEGLFQSLGISAPNILTNYLSKLQLARHYMPKIKAVCNEVNSADPLIQVWNQILDQNQKLSMATTFDSFGDLETFNGKGGDDREIKDGELAYELSQALRTLSVEKDRFAPFLKAKKGGDPPRGGPQKGNPREKKMPLCRFWPTNECRNGADCRFRHEGPQTEGPPADSVNPSKFERKFYPP